jgi:hypothetical protein
LNEGDHTELMPATLDDIAVEDDSGQPGARRRAMIVAAATGVLLLVGGGWAVVRGSASTPLDALATPSPRRTAFSVDGFGVGSPVPPPSPTAAPVRVTSTPAPSGTASSSAQPSTPADSSPPPPPVTVGSPYTASISTQYWEKGMWVEVTLVNKGSQPLDWRLTLELSPRVTVGQPWNAVVGDREDDTLLLQPPTSYGPLQPGKSMKVGFVGTWEDATRHLTISSCALNGVACTGSLS